MANRCMLHRLLLLLTSALGMAGSGIAAATTHSYTLEFAPDLRSVRVTAALAEAGLTLRADEGDADRAQDVRGCDGERIRVRGSRLIAGSGVTCLTYRHSVDPVRPSDRMPTRFSTGFLTTPDEWLYLPPLGNSDHVELRLRVPEGTSVSAPWAVAGHVTDEQQGWQVHFFRLAATPGSSRGLLALGRFPQPELTVGDSRIRYALLANSDRYEATLSEWLTTSLEDVYGVYGRLPNPDLQILVVPVSTSDRNGSPVPFGHVIRDGGETVRFFVNERAPVAAFHADWTATHEFAHLTLPYVRERWISEGFASYYQNVLLARRGIYSQSEVWRRLGRSFDQAQGTVNPPRLKDVEQRSFWEMRMLIYWSGAAIALLADAELRERSGGTETLDRVLGALQSCCLPGRRTWTGRELFTQLDALTEYPVFVELFDEYANSRGMPDFEPLFERLGVVRNGGSVRLDDEAEAAWVRRAIMTRSQPVAWQPEG